MRIFFGPTEVAGYYSSLRRGLEAEGIDVMFADFSTNERKYDDGERSVVVRSVRGIERMASAIPSRHRRLHAIAHHAVSPARVALFLWAALRCDVFVYAYGSTITFHPEWELRVLRRLGRRIIFSFHGSDSRPPYLGHPWISGDAASAFDSCAELAAQIKATVRLARRYADAITENPFSAHFHVGPCVNALVYGNPCPPVDESVAVGRSENGPIRILHSPSDPRVKGTDVIRLAVAAVKARGRDIEYIELVGKSHAEVIEEIARCDFVIDQAYSDTPMALFATEAAGLGKPVIVGGYITPREMATYIRPEWLPPVYYCHPSNLVDAVDKLCTDVAFRRELGERAQAFVQRERNPRTVAQRFLLIAKNQIPAEWLFDPLELEYVHGLGEEGHIRQLIRGVVEYGGVSALQLDDNPSVRAKILAFGGVTDESPTDGPRDLEPASVRRIDGRGPC